MQCHGIKNYISFVLSSYYIFLSLKTYQTAMEVTLDLEFDPSQSPSKDIRPSLFWKIILNLLAFPSRVSAKNLIKYK